MTVAVYCASSNQVSDAFRAGARLLGRRLAEDGHAVIFGGGSVGLMGELARSAHAHGGHVTGVIPERLMAIEGRAYGTADEMIVTDTMQERKRIIFTRADAFVVLPGGLGTLEEFLEVATLRKLGYHQKPVILLNLDGFFDTLLAFFREAAAAGLLGSGASAFMVRPDPDAILELLDRSAALPNRP